MKNKLAIAPQVVISAGHPYLWLCAFQECGRITFSGHLAVAKDGNSVL